MTMCGFKLRLTPFVELGRHLSTNAYQAWIYDRTDAAVKAGRKLTPVRRLKIDPPWSVGEPA
jgi:hypothetical protein